MLPHNHFLIANLVIASVGIVLFSQESISKVGEWVLLGGFISSTIDLDIYTLTILKSRKEKRLKLFRNPIKIYRKFKLFMDTITETGVLKTGLKIHFLSSAFIILICYLFLNNYLIPVTLGVVSHLISDIPNLRRFVK